MSIASLFNICQGPLESLRGYLTCFNEATTKVVPLNQEMFMGALQNRLKVGPFSESLAQNPTITLTEVVARTECYIKGDEIKAKKKDHNTKERVPDTKSSHLSRKNRHTLHMKDKSLFKWARKAVESFTPLNTHREHI